MAKQWSDPSILKALPNPSTNEYEIRIVNPEITFLGAPNQPDFATLYITYCPDAKIIELKALKLYFYQFRNTLVSYERLVNVVFQDIMNVYQPKRLMLTMVFRTRGGMDSTLTIDSVSQQNNKPLKNEN